MPQLCTARSPVRTLLPRAPQPPARLHGGWGGMDKVHTGRRRAARLGVPQEAPAGVTVLGAPQGPPSTGRVWWDGTDFSSSTDTFCAAPAPTEPPPTPSESPQQPHPSIHRSLIISSCPQDSPKTFSVLLTPSVELSAPHIPQHSPPVHPRCPPPPAALSATPPYRHPAPSLEPRPRGRGAADLARPLAAACPPARGPPSATL